jgi:hypothetical protein
MTIDTASLLEIANTINKQTLESFIFGLVNDKKTIAANNQVNFISQQTGSTTFPTVENLEAAFRKHRSYRNLKVSFQKSSTQKWDDGWLEHLPKLYALSFVNKAHALYLENIKRDENKLKKYKHCEALGKDNVTDTPDENDSLYLNDTIRQLYTNLMYGGVGNCEPMADLAMLFAIHMEGFSESVHRIRFLKTNSLDELNCIALGSFPNPGCVIVSPWSSEENQVFIWNGDLANTEKVQGYKAYETIITIESESQFRKEVGDFLKEKKVNFPNWHNAENIANIHRLASEFVAKFTELFQPVKKKPGFFSGATQPQNQIAGAPRQQRTS